MTTQPLHPPLGTRSPAGTTDIGERLRIGFITHLDQSEDVSTVYRENIGLVQQLEQQGYDSAWIATRHFGSGWATLPTPYAFLGALATNTERIGLGTAVLPVIFDDAVRVAEELSVIDHLSGHRLLAGLGKGVPSDSYHVFEAYEPDRDRSFEHKIDTLHWGLEGNRIEGGSASIYPADTALQGRLFHGSSNLDTIRFAARRGDGFILERFGNGPERHPDQRRTFQQRQAESVLEYRRVFRETWGETRTPYVVTSRTAYPAETTQRALEEASVRAAHWNEYAGLLGRVNPEHSPADQLLSDNFVWGDPETLAADLLDDPTVLLSDELVLGIHPTLHTVEETAEKARILIEEVVPLLREGWARGRAELLAGERAGADPVGADPVGAERAEVLS
jgi:alkanesulfonate monooxygenase SsuD/methylene tetrahydromethanopterin reductase-like flavin-dependent oxidoreductase (luciferase family)